MSLSSSPSPSRPRVQRRLALACLTVCLGTMVFAVLAAPAEAKIFYVNGAYSKPGNGTSWRKAFHSLQSALKAAKDGDEIWIAAGVYKPTRKASRQASFKPRLGVSLYGGFKGIEKQRTERNWQQNQTILSGDIGKAGHRDDNSFHILIAQDRVVLDGLIFEYGHANGPRDEGRGAAIFVKGRKAPILRDLLFRQNSAREGGALYATDRASPSLTSVAFQNNRAARGGAMLLRGESFATLTRAAFVGNFARWRGGAVFIDHGAQMHSVDVRFENNETKGHGGAIAIDQAASEVYSTQMTLNTGHFRQNTAAGRGGALHGFEKVIVDLRKVTFDSNKAQAGGGAIATDYETALQLRQDSFSDNDGHAGRDNIDESEATLVRP